MVMIMKSGGSEVDIIIHYTDGSIDKRSGLANYIKAEQHLENMGFEIYSESMSTSSLNLASGAIARGAKVIPVRATWEDYADGECEIAEVLNVSDKYIFKSTA